MTNGFVDFVLNYDDNVDMNRAAVKATELFVQYIHESGYIINNFESSFFLTCNRPGRCMFNFKTYYTLAF
jgi:hypothetical protein